MINATEFSYLYAIGWDAGFVKMGVSGDPVGRLKHLRGTLGSQLELRCVIQLPLKTVMLIETCSHSLLGRGVLENECYLVSIEEAFAAMVKAIDLVDQGLFGKLEALAYCNEINPAYHGQRYRPKCASVIPPDRIVVPGKRLQPLILTYEKAKEAIRAGMSFKDAAKSVGLAVSTLYRDIPGGAQSILEDDVDLPPTS